MDTCAMYVDQNPDQGAYHLGRAVEESRFGPYMVGQSYNTAEELKAFLRRIDLDSNRQKKSEPAAAAGGNGGGGRARNNNNDKDKDKQPERSLPSSMNYGMTKAYDWSKIGQSYKPMTQSGWTACLRRMDASHARRRDTTVAALTARSSSTARSAATTTLSRTPRTQCGQ
ncbi:uncharacterized protein MYCGRDRAFT_98111 [Zymoseptoria tritici IPO323]|uniref:Uncharacterized protein n=1 Tax=Zymoseptoria tritici (strain CBS 115943 / IPO323) TaxID=336722 RepID=F9XSC2_ZYMTI|nr:uncharacterized protein MYCGRDRAFT_98111 [Zymoseptoria tritici IPO323]EGP81861.1 hypothetical protein MYCGRDRAFT_98111 [Zymoseptoria tritici IPO323]